MLRLRGPPWGMMSGDTETLRSLLCRVNDRLCAIPITCVIETMRPLPLEPMAGAPAFVLGLSIIRGVPVPVVDAALLLGAPASAGSRYVSVRVGGRRVALSVDEVVGVEDLGRGSVGELPPLLRDASSEVIAAIGALDAELLLVLHEASIVPDSVWRLSSDEAAT